MRNGNQQTENATRLLSVHRAREFRHRFDPDAMQRRRAQTAAALLCGEDSPTDDVLDLFETTGLLGAAAHLGYRDLSGMTLGTLSRTTGPWGRHPRTARSRGRTIFGKRERRLGPEQLTTHAFEVASVQCPGSSSPMHQRTTARYR